LPRGGGEALPGDPARGVSPLIPAGRCSTARTALQRWIAPRSLRRWSLPALTARAAAAPGGVLSLTAHSQFSENGLAEYIHSRGGAHHV